MFTWCPPPKKKKKKSDDWHERASLPLSVRLGCTSWLQESINTSTVARLDDNRGALSSCAKWVWNYPQLKHKLCDHSNQALAVSVSQMVWYTSVNRWTSTTSWQFKNYLSVICADYVLSATVVSARWATVDWSWHKEWNWCVQANIHFKKKKKKVQAGNNGRTFSPNPCKQGKNHHQTCDSKETLQDSPHSQSSPQWYLSAVFLGHRNVITSVDCAGVLRAKHLIQHLSSKSFDFSFSSCAIFMHFFFKQK